MTEKKNVVSWIRHLTDKTNNERKALNLNTVENLEKNISAFPSKKILLLKSISEGREALGCITNRKGLKRRKTRNSKNDFVVMELKSYI